MSIDPTMKRGDPSQRGPTLRIVAVNDVYSLENLPRLKTLVAHYAATDPADRMLVTLAGDFLAPSILSSLDAGRGMVACMNAVGFTHVIFGNHEDDVSTDELRKRVHELDATWIEIAHIGSRSVRVGLLGVVMDDPTAYHRKPFGGVDVESPNRCLVRETARLMTVGQCSLVIPITHQPVAEDRALARLQRDPPFSVIVGGHEHTGFMEQVEGTWLIKASADAIHAIVIDLEWPIERPALPAPDAPRVSVKRDPVAGYPEDPVLRSLVNSHMKRVDELEAATLVKLAPGELLSSVGTRSRQTTLGTLVCSSIRDSLGADGCIFNGGGIRACRDYKDRFTYGDIKAEVPFDNEIVVVSLKGRVVSEAVSASRASAPDESGGFLQVDDRMKVSSESGDLIEIAGHAIDLDSDYRIALIRDLLSGMDHEEPLVRYAHAHPERLPPAGSGRDVKLVLVDAFAKALWSKLGGFDAIDTNRDGVVSEVELGNAIAAYTAEPVSPITADLVIHALDTNRDRNISREEAESGMAPKKPNRD
jgi:2',3'-cyclic-nucleotide 2'-phosphodiesterase (5'-nucleotidase family)